MDKLVKFTDVFNIEPRNINKNGGVKIRITEGRNITIRNKPSVFAYGHRGGLDYVFIVIGRNLKALRFARFKAVAFPLPNLIGTHSIKQLPEKENLVITHNRYWEKYKTQRLLDCIEGKLLFTERINDYIFERTCLKECSSLQRYLKI